MTKKKVVQLRKKSLKKGCFSFTFCSGDIDKSQGGVFNNYLIMAQNFKYIIEFNHII